MMYNLVIANDLYLLYLLSSLYRKKTIVFLLE